MKTRIRKILLMALAVLLLLAASGVQSSMNRDRDRLHLTRNEVLDNAPPVLAFTTVALGGFRGLIANALWIRANDLQLEDKFFEMAQLAEWITKLEPHFVQVWLVQSWNMAFNISVKFKDPEDRWRWVQRGIELLRDEGLEYNPGEPLMYRELSWLFQFKLGHNLDDANVYYKEQWAKEMTAVFGAGRPDFDALINPQTDEQKERARLLRERYKMDPVFVKRVDDECGPLEWRLPEAHAIYWAALGLDHILNNPRGNQDQLLSLRRSIFQSMQLAFTRGRLISNPLVPFDTGPNVDIMRQVNDAYEKQIKEEPEMAENFRNAHRNFLIRGVYYLYLQNRRTGATQWFNYLKQRYPNKPILESRPDSLPGNLTLDEFAVARVQADVKETDLYHIESAIEGLLLQYFLNLSVGQNDQALVYERLARQVHARFTSETSDSAVRLPLEPLSLKKKEMLSRLLDPDYGFPKDLADVLRAEFNIPAGQNILPSGTNAPASSAIPGQE